MTLEQALATLRQGGPLHELLDAVATASAAAPISELARGLAYPGVVAEQTAFALYRRAGRPIPADRTRLISDIADHLGLTPPAAPASGPKR